MSLMVSRNRQGFLSLKVHSHTSALFSLNTAGFLWLDLDLMLSMISLQPVSLPEMSLTGESADLFLIFPLCDLQVSLIRADPLQLSPSSPTVPD